ncbi:hypothetical protein Dsin_017361 [Dipteronia sinensis]|uniref:Ribonuclease H1 N-terminal domain-containing protein n=1 Tax=Dipteronia sinensis TaxID=43782 RepID=A0AAE0AEW2_9ROSI|nr:hypothetical protein Dsin_017361 [Dipteronia sinensis]
MVQTVVQTFGVEAGLDKQEKENVVGEEGGLEAGLDRVESWLHADTGGLDKEEMENVVGEACGSAKHAINLDDFPSPSVNMILPNPNLSVIFMEAADPNVCYKNNDMKISHHRSSVYTGQAIEMNRELFKELVKPTKWISNLHIDNYLDVLWKRLSSREIDLLAITIGSFVGLFALSSSSVLSFAVCWLFWFLGVMGCFVSAMLCVVGSWFPGLMCLQKEVKNITKKKMKKKEEIDLTPAVPIWEEYTEYDPLSFQPDEDALDYVSDTLVTNPRVFFDLSIDGHPAGRIVMELFADSTPDNSGELSGSLYQREGDGHCWEATPLQGFNLPPRDTWISLQGFVDHSWIPLVLISPGFTNYFRASMYFVYASDDVGPLFLFPIETVDSGWNIGGQLYRVFSGASYGHKNTPSPSPLQLHSNTCNPSKVMKTGVFNSWPDFHEQVDGFKGASYQKFNTVDEAYQAICAVQREKLSNHTSGTIEDKVLCTEPVQTKTVMLVIYIIFVFVIGVTVGKCL